MFIHIIYDLQTLCIQIYVASVRYEHSTFTGGCSDHMSNRIVSIALCKSRANMPPGKKDLSL